MDRKNGKRDISTSKKKQISKLGFDELLNVLCPHDSNMEINVIKKSERIHVKPLTILVFLHTLLKLLSKTLFEQYS